MLASKTTAVDVLEKNECVCSLTTVWIHLISPVQYKVQTIVKYITFYSTKAVQE
jgi:hypothetical protein